MNFIIEYFIISCRLGYFCDTWSVVGGEYLAIFNIGKHIMSELGIFIDESGFLEKDNSENTKVRDLYIVSFLLHNKSISINDDLKVFENYLIQNGFNPQMPIHTMPLIRMQKPYSEYNRETRKKLFHCLFQFMRKLKIKHKTFVCDKKYCPTKQAIKQDLENYINQIIKDHYDYFKKFNEIVIYYDEGQNYLTKILHKAFSSNFANHRFKEDVCQEEYRLLQCADMICSLELIKQRMEHNECIKAIDKFFASKASIIKTMAKFITN